MSSAVIIGVGGGKGGVGKSLVSVGIGVALADLGLRTVLVDADLGAANLHTLLGIERPAHTLNDFVERRVKSLEEAVIPTNVDQLSMVAGSGGAPTAANPVFAQKQKILRALRKLHADFVVVDVGAGTAHNTVDFFLATDHRVVVLAPQLTSLHNAYCFLKASIFRSLWGLTPSTESRDLLKSMVSGSATESMRDILRRAELEEIRTGTRWRESIESFGLSIVGNMLENQVQHHVVRSFARMASDLLALEPHATAFIPRDEQVHAAVNKRDAPSAVRGKVSAEFAALVERLVTVDVTAWRADRERAAEESHTKELATSSGVAA